MASGFVFNKIPYFVMAVLQLIVVCLVVILWASVLMFLHLIYPLFEVCGVCGEGGSVDVSNELYSSYVWVVV